MRRSAETVRHLVDDTATPLLLDLSEPAEAEVDPRRVERILRNLLANAIDHGERRPIEVRVAADDHAVAVVVRDHGLGLKPGEAGLVFNRFWRADPRGSAAAAGPVWAWRSASRTPACRAAGCRRGARPTTARCSA